MIAYMLSFFTRGEKWARWAATHVDRRDRPGAFGALNRPVVEATGLKGRYDFRIDTLPYVEAGIRIRALQDELGRKLESRRDNANILGVDHAEKTPTEN